MAIAKNSPVPAAALNKNDLLETKAAFKDVVKNKGSNEKWLDEKARIKDRISFIKGTLNP